MNVLMSRVPTRWHFQPIKSLSVRSTPLPVFLRKIVVILGNKSVSWDLICNWIKWAEVPVYNAFKAIRISIFLDFLTPVSVLPDHAHSVNHHWIWFSTYSSLICKARFSYAAEINHVGHGRRHGLRHRYGTCEQLSPNHNDLSQALTAGLLGQLRRQAGGCRRWKYFMWTSADAKCTTKYCSMTIRSIFIGGMVEIAPIRFVFAQIWVHVDGPSQMHRCFGDTGTDRRPWSVATGG